MLNSRFSHSISFIVPVLSKEPRKILILVVQLHHVGLFDTRRFLHHFVHFTIFQPLPLLIVALDCDCVVGALNY